MPARLIIRLLFGFASDSVFIELKLRERAGSWSNQKWSIETGQRLFGRYLRYFDTSDDVNIKY